LMSFVWSNRIYRNRWTSSMGSSRHYPHQASGRTARPRSRYIHHIFIQQSILLVRHKKSFECQTFVCQSFIHISAKNQPQAQASQRKNPKCELAPSRRQPQPRHRRYWNIVDYELLIM